jgi:hypothetical protein
MPDPTDAEKRARILVELAVVAAFDRAGLTAVRQGAPRLGKDAAVLAVESLSDAGLLLTPQAAAVLAAARAWRQCAPTRPSYDRTPEAARLAAAVDAEEASRP